MPMPRVFVHLDHGRSPDSWTRAFEAGIVLQDSPYQYNLAGEHLDLRYSVDRVEGPPIRFVRRALAAAVGFDIIHAWRNRREMDDADVIWTHSEHEYLAIALLKRLKLIRRVQVLGQTIWLWDEWADLGRWRQRFFRWLLGAVDLLTSHSRLNADRGREILGRKVIVVPYGINWPFNATLQVRPLVTRVRVVAPGHDRHRDWRTLVHAIAGMQMCDALILSRRRTARVQARRSSSVSVERSSGREILGEYARADVVAIPLSSNLHASGITVALEAIAAGRGVAISNTGGLDDYLEGLVVWARVGDAGSLARAIRIAAKVSTDEALLQARRELLVARGLTLHDYAMRHVILTRHMLGMNVDLTSVSSLSPVVL